MKSYFFLITAFTLSVFSSCTRDFIEPDLSDKSIQVITPYNNLFTTTSTLTFWWYEIEGASQYEIQIVSGSFSSATQIIADTNVTGDKFIFSLQPGTYQWRIKGFNTSSSSLYTIYNLTIDSTADLTNQVVTLTSPSNSLITNQTLHTCKWNLLYNADDYRFQIFNLSNSSTVVDVVVFADSFSYTLPEGQYKWQVRAQNSFSNSAYFFRTITIDTTAPAPSTLLLPINADTIALNDTLTWSRNSSAIADSLFIDSDSLFNNPVFISTYTANTFYILQSGTPGQTYFWRLRSVDAAANWSSYSITRKFKLQ